MKEVKTAIALIIILVGCQKNHVITKDVAVAYTQDHAIAATAPDPIIGDNIATVTINGNVQKDTYYNTDVTTVFKQRLGDTTTYDIIFSLAGYPDGLATMTRKSIPGGLFSLKLLSKTGVLYDSMRTNNQGYTANEFVSSAPPIPTTDATWLSCMQDQVQFCSQSYFCRVKMGYFWWSTFAAWSMGCIRRQIHS